MSIKSKLLSTFISAMAFTAVSTTSLAATTSIDFEGTGAPCCFGNTAPLTNFYAGQGVTFSGSGGSGGYILNQSGNFGFNARSGSDFLAFNTGSGTGTIQVMTFSNAASSVSIWANDNNFNRFTLEAFDVNNISLDLDSVDAGQGWQELTVSGAGIAYVSLSGMLTGAWAYDDLSFSDDRQSVPEPGSLALVGLGLAAFALRKRKTS